MTRKTYTDEEKAEFCELAQEIGIGRTIRQLGYPSYPAGVAWMRARGIEPSIDKTMQAIKEYHTRYTTEDLLIRFDMAITLAEDMMLEAKTADDLKRIAEALYKIVQTRQLLEGKATAISEKRETTQQDLEIMELLSMEQARNAAIEKNESLSEVENHSS